MAFTDNFRRQHDELVAIVTEIAGDANDAANKADAIAANLGKLSGKIRMHLTIEDKTLYPRLIGSADANTVATAKKFQDEMGDLAGVYTGFASKWQTAGDIQGNPAGFKSEFNGIVSALSTRINSENTVLYPLADQC